MRTSREARIGGGPGVESKQERSGPAPGRHTLTERLAEAAHEATRGGTDRKGRAADSGGGGGDAETAGPAKAGATAADGAAGAAKPAAADAPSQAAPAAEAPRASKQESVMPRMSLGGSAVAASVTSDHQASSEHATKHQAVAATGNPTFNAAAGSNDCTPNDVDGSSVTWEVVASPSTWGVNIKSFTTMGVINVAPWPSKPTEMVTPNTANPVDGGNITDAAGDNNWKFAVKEMTEYHQAGGGRSSYWHSYKASEAHERAHWNTDWMVTCIGALWPATNTDLDAITIPKANAADAAAARPLLQAKIDARMKTFNRALTVKWNAIPDTPGVAGSTGYDAGQAVLNGLIASVNAYAAKKKWT